MIHDEPRNRAGSIVIINDASVGRGGATGLALLAAQGLAARGRDVTYLSGDDFVNDELIHAGVTLWVAGGSHIMKASRAKSFLVGLHNRAVVQKLANWVQEHDKPDTIYHVHGWSKIYSPAVFRALKAVAPRIVIHAHDFFLACPNGAFWNYPKGEICEMKPLSTSCLLSNCDRRSFFEKAWRTARTGILRQFLDPGEEGPEILLIHPAMIPYFVRSGYATDRLTVLRNPVVPFSDKPVDAARNQAAAFVGRLNPEKGGLVLAEACQKARMPLIVIGEGPESEAIAKTGAKMFGWRNRDQIGHILKDARVLVMPSQYPEPFGLVAVEALGSGLPVVVARTALLATEITQAGAGYTVDVSNQSALVECLQTISRDDLGVEARCHAALRIAPQLGSSMDGWLDGLEAAYSRAITGAKILSEETRLRQSGR